MPEFKQVLVFKEVIARNLEQECIDGWALSHVVPLNEIQAYLIFQRDNKTKPTSGATEATPGAKPIETKGHVVPKPRKQKAVPPHQGGLS